MKIFCVGRNYADHAKELGNAVPEEPVIFMKPKTALMQSNAPFYYPEFSNELHYEAEVVLRICKNGKYVEEENAEKYYDAFTIGIDFTARDIQNELKKKGLPWDDLLTAAQSALSFWPDKIGVWKHRPSLLGIGVNGGGFERWS